MTVGSRPTEGLVYFPGELSYDLKRRPASSLLVTPMRAGPLGNLPAASAVDGSDSIS